VSLADDASAAIDAHRDALLTLSHTIHANPELGYEEFISSSATASTASAGGLVVESEAAGLATAFRATAGNGALHVAFCAEFDALPDVGHACGHNIIAAASTGAAIGLAAVAKDLDCSVVLLGTPSEEGGGGKIDLINAGYFDDVHVAMMVHPWPTERLSATCLAVDHFDVAFTGHEAHASAAPWEGVNALDAFIVAQVAISQLRQQLRPLDQVHGYLMDGGVAANIIPARTVARFMCRSRDVESLRQLRARVNACFEAGALATGATISFTELGHQFSQMEADLDVLAHYRDAATSLGRRFDLDDAGEAPPTISTDMANVSLVVPTIHPLIAIETHGAVNHQPDFTRASISPSADEAVLDGAKALALTAISVAQDGSLRARLLGR
jgi:amidohydrolase